MPTTDNWKIRREQFIDRLTIYDDLQELIDKAHSNDLSLALFRPSEWRDFTFEECEREWDPKRLAALEAERQQQDFFKSTEQLDKEFQVVDKLPYKFRYQFEDIKGKTSELMIEDWEIGALYRNCLRGANGNEQEAVAKVRQKYWEEFILSEKKDTLLILGTTLEFHNKKTLNPFVIIGVVPLPKKSSGLF